jgi:hypothetical protein
MAPMQGQKQEKETTMKVQATLGVLAALAAAGATSANAAGQSDIAVASKPAAMSAAAFEQLSNELTVTEGKIRVAMPKIKGYPTWVQFTQSKK